MAQFVILIKFNEYFDVVYFVKNKDDICQEEQALLDMILVSEENSQKNTDAATAFVLLTDDDDEYLKQQEAFFQAFVGPSILEAIKNSSPWKELKSNIEFYNFTRENHCVLYSFRHWNSK